MIEVTGDWIDDDGDFGFEVEDHEPGDRRRQPRVTPDHVDCLLGKVINMNTDGMQVYRMGSAAFENGDSFDVVLHHPGDDPLCLVARVVWSEKINNREFVYGLTFVEMDEEKHNRLAFLLAQPVAEEECTAESSNRSAA